MRADHDTRGDRGGGSRRRRRRRAGEPPASGLLTPAGAPSARLLLLSRCGDREPILALAGYFAASRYVFYNAGGCRPRSSGSSCSSSPSRARCVEVALDRLAGRGGRAAGPWRQGAGDGDARAPGTISGPLARLRLIPVLVGFVLICLGRAAHRADLGRGPMGELIAAWQAVRERLLRSARSVVSTRWISAASSWSSWSVYVLTSAIRTGAWSGARCCRSPGSMRAGAAAIVAGLGYLGVTVLGVPRGRGGGGARSLEPRHRGRRALGRHRLRAAERW